MVLTWGAGNELILHTDSLQNKKSSKILHLQWSSSISHPVVRCLVNESNGTFLSLQKLMKEGTEQNNVQLIKISRNYRSIMKACIENLSGGGLETEEKSLHHLFYKLELIWHLCEVLFIDVQPRGVVILQLLDWVHQHFPACIKATQQCLEAENPENHPMYWEAVYGNILCGRGDQCRNLLRLHSDASSNAMRSVDELIRKMPVYNSHRGQSFVEFEQTWHRWQEECKVRLNEGEFTTYRQLNNIVKILSGDVGTMKELIDLFDCWYQLMISILLYRNPTVKYFDLSGAAQESLLIFTEARGGQHQEHIDNIILAAIDCDAHQVISECHGVLDNCWFSAHLTDLLTHAGHLDSNKDSGSLSLRERLLLDYAGVLCSHPSLWQVGVDYLDHCEALGRQHIHAFISHIQPDTQHKANKIISIAQHRNMKDVVLSVCKVMCRESLQRKSLGSALSWALKSQDVELMTQLANMFLTQYTEQGELSCSQLIDNLGAQVFISDRLTFLSKFSEFTTLFEKERFKEAADLLVSLLTSQSAPKSFWLTLLLNAIPLLECEQAWISTEQTYSLMSCLEDLHTIAIGTEQPKLLPPEKEGLIRIALARNLATAFITETTQAAAMR